VRLRIADVLTYTRLISRVLEPAKRGTSAGLGEGVGATRRANSAEVRVGMHTGEIELRGDDVAGVPVNIGFRVAAGAGPGEVLVSRTVPDLVAGSGIGFEDCGEHELKGVPGHWRLFAVVHLRPGRTACSA
jgi:class 3 adenylate cyclase